MRDTAKVAGTTLTKEEWKPSVGCSKSKAHRFAVLKMKIERADKSVSWVFCNLAGAMKHPSVRVNGGGLDEFYS